MRMLETNSSWVGAILAPFGILDAGRHSVDGEDVHTAA